MYKRLGMLGIAALAMLAVAGSWAEGAPQIFSGWHEPRWVTNLDGFDGSVRIEGVDYLAEAVAVYTYPNGQEGTVHAEPDEKDPAVWHFTIPAAPEAGPGQMSYYVELRYGMHGTDRRSSETRVLPLSYAKELDITGEAAKPLYYPLPDDAYRVRYIPCCNIYGGMTYAERVPVCTADTKDGLPDKLLSDFVILRPDGLSASTMGMYFDFILGPEAVKGLTEDQIGLYEFVGDHWAEVQTYSVTPETGKVSTHFPDGGMLVVGLKP